MQAALAHSRHSSLEHRRKAKALKQWSRPQMFQKASLARASWFASIGSPKDGAEWNRTVSSYTLSTSAAAVAWFRLPAKLLQRHRRLPRGDGGGEARSSQPKAGTSLQLHKRLAEQRPAHIKSLYTCFGQVPDTIIIAEGLWKGCTDGGDMNRDGSGISTALGVPSPMMQEGPISALALCDEWVHVLAHLGPVISARSQPLVFLRDGIVVIRLFGKSPVCTGSA